MVDISMNELIAARAIRGIGVSFPPTDGRPASRCEQKVPPLRSCLKSIDEISRAGKFFTQVGLG
jgi:hypothetical protein